MEAKKPPPPTMVRIAPKVKKAFERARVALDLEANQERTTEALWLWFSRLPPAQAEEFLRREFAALDDFLGGDTLPEAQPPKPRLGKDLGQAETPRRTRRSG